MQVVAGMLARGSLWFAARKKAGKSHAGLWEFPGGKVHPGEMPEAALVREWEEEFGWPIVPLEPLEPILSQTAAGAPLWLMPWKITSKAWQPKWLNDHDALAWFKLKNYQNLPWGPADAALLEREKNQL